MKTRNILFLAALASTVFIGCNNDDEAGQAQLPDLSGTPIRIQAGIGESVLTRAGEDETPQVTVLTEGEFGLFLTTTEAPNDTRYNATNMKFSHTDSGWTSTGQLLWKNNSATVKYYAYMPYQEEGITEAGNETCNLKFTVPTDQSAADGGGVKAADFLYAASKEVTATTNGSALGTIDIMFEHQLSYLTVKLTRLKTAEDVTFSSVTLQGCAMSATFNLAEGKFVSEDGTTEKKDISLWHATTVTGGGENTTDAFEGILIPQPFQTMTILISGTDSKGNMKNYKYAPSAAEDLPLKSGGSYTLELKVGNAVTCVGTVSVSEWGGSDWTPEQGKGEAEEMPMSSPEQHTVTTYSKGQIADNPGLIESAIGTGNTLIIEGPMDDTDIEALKTYLVAHPAAALELDLSKVTELTAFPDYGFSEYNGTTTLGLKSIILPDVMTKIGANAFISYCTELESVTLPAGLKEIGGAAFFDCKKLSTIKVAGGATNELPEGLTTLEGGIFSGTILETITIPASLTTTTVWTLNGMTSLKKVYWNSSAETPFECFVNCTSLTDIYFTSETAPTVNADDNIFGQLPQSITIHIPAAYETNYSAWKALETNDSGWNITCTTE